MDNFAAVYRNNLQSSLKKRIEFWRWTLPIGFAVFVLLYQLVLVRWVHDTINDVTHFAVEVLFFATVGPLLTFFALTQIRHWVEEKERAEQQARANERWLASVTAASADAILSLDTQGCIESWNRGAELLFGYGADEMNGRFLAAIFGQGEPAEVEARWLVQRVQQLGIIRDHETTAHCADGRHAVVDLTATKIIDDQEKMLGVSIILRDITKRKQREKEIRQLNVNLNRQVAARTYELAEKVDALAQANTKLQKLDQTRSELVSLVSHQVRAPLTNVQGAVARMGSDCDAVNSTCSRMFNIINQQVTRLDHLVQDVLEANRLEAGELLIHPEPISIVPVLRQVADQVGSRLSNRDISVADVTGLPLAYADRDRLTEVVANLLDNADKYSPIGQKIWLNARANEAEVVLSVRDFGNGLPEAELERIFEKFYRTDSSDAQSAYGYGLGLFVCRRLVEAQNGRIWAENHPKGGAIFSVALPVWQEANG
jgi:PAS domain S-box-containing protein